jgi:hypothetical protein
MSREQSAHEELQLYTYSLGDADFVHQHVVDAWTLQHADSRTKPIALAFSLLGLHLHLERGFSGRQVQRVHMDLSRRREALPAFRVPSQRPALTVLDVMSAPPGPARLRALDAWCASVWQAWSCEHEAVARWMERCGID